MSEQEKKSGGPGSGGGSPLVMVEQSTASRHKPYRPNELQDEAPPELHNKRSRAPAVPPVVEELKDTADNTDIKERKECEHAMSSEKQKHIVAKKLSSTTKRRGTSPETVILAPLEVEKKRADTTTPTSQPIPSHVGPVTSGISDLKANAEAEKKGDEDSITEEIAELRTFDATQKVSEWDIEDRIQYVPENQDIEDTVSLQRKFASEIINGVISGIKHQEDAREIEPTHTVSLQRKLGSELVNETITSTQQLLKKKEITWSSATYVNKVQLQNFNDRTAAWMLERKASVGPCYRKTLPYGEPSGITICLPKKSARNISDNSKPTKSGITITVSKRCINNNLKLENVNENLPRKENKSGLKIEGEHCDILGNLRGKLDILRGKIKHVLHM